MSKQPKQAGKGVSIVIKHPVKPPDSESEEHLNSSDEDPTWDHESERKTKQAGKGVHIVIKHPVKPPDSESEEHLNSSDEDPTWDPKLVRKTKQAGKRATSVIKHPVKPPNPKSKEHLSSSAGNSNPSWYPESDRKTDLSLSLETMKVKERAPAIQQHAVQQSSPIEFPLSRRETRSSAKLKEPGGVVVVLLCRPEPKGAQHQKPITLEDIVNSDRSSGMPKQLLDPPKVRFKRRLKELDYERELEAAEILVDLNVAEILLKLGGRATPADEDKIGSPATNLDQQAGDIPPATDEDPDDVTPAASPDRHPGDVPPATSPDQYRKAIPRSKDHEAGEIISPATDDVTPSASPDQLGVNIPPATDPHQEHVGGNPRTTGLYSWDSPAAVEGVEDVTTPASPDHQSGNNSLVTHHHQGNIPPPASQDQLERDISLAVSDQQKGDTLPSPSPGPPIQSNSQVGYNRLLRAIQSGFSPDGEATSHGRSPNPVPAPVPTEGEFNRWCEKFELQKRLRLKPEPEPEPSGDA